MCYSVFITVSFKFTLLYLQHLLTLNAFVALRIAFQPGLRNLYRTNMPKVLNVKPTYTCTLLRQYGQFYFTVIHNKSKKRKFIIKLDVEWRFLFSKAGTLSFHQHYANRDIHVNYNWIKIHFASPMSTIFIIFNYDLTTLEDVFNFK